MVTTTTTYSFKKPTVGDDEDLWGGYLNDSMDLIDDVLDGTTPVTGIDINSGTIDNAVIGGTTPVAGTFTALTANTSLGVTGNITVSGTVDGRDVAADGTKLDGIESGATADQTKADIDALGIAASTASTLATARNIALSGDVSGSASFNGSANISITATVADDSHNHVISNVDGLQTALDAKYDASNPSGYTTYSANQSLDTTNSPSFAGLNINGNLNAVDNIYLAGTLYHEGDTNTYLTFGTDSITLTTGGSSEITVNTTGVRLGDTGNGYFQPVTGGYGSIQIDSGAHGGYEGYSIGGRVAFLHDNNVDGGLWNDVNDEWLLRYQLNDKVQLYHNGTSKLQTTTDGVQINGSLFALGSVAEDYDALSGTTPTCNVDNAAAFSLTMTGNTTFSFSGAGSGYSQGFILQLTGNGSTVTWPSSVDWAGGTAPDAPASGETDILVFWTRDGGTTWYGVLSIDAAA